MPKGRVSTGATKLSLEVEDSHITLHIAPGLGIDLIEDVLKDHPAKDFPRRTIGD